MNDLGVEGRGPKSPGQLVVAESRIGAHLPWSPWLPLGVTDFSKVVVLHWLQLEILGIHKYSLPLEAWLRYVSKDHYLTVAVG